MANFLYPTTRTLDERGSIHEEALRLRTQRFELLASNIANADTPNYKARDIDFSTALERAVSARHTFAGLAATTKGHMRASAESTHPDVLYRVPTQSSLDGNTVEMDQERVAFAENAMRLQFSLQEAIGDYTSKLDMLKRMTP